LAVAGFFLRLDQPGLAGTQRRFVPEGAAIGADPCGAFGAAGKGRPDRLALQAGHQEAGDEAVAGAQRVDDIGRDDALREEPASVEGQRAQGAARDDDLRGAVRGDEAREAAAGLLVAAGVGQEGDVEIGRGPRDIGGVVFAGIVEGEQMGRGVEAGKLVLQPAVDARMGEVEAGDIGEVDVLQPLVLTQAGMAAVEEAVIAAMADARP